MHFTHAGASTDSQARPSAVRHSLERSSSKREKKALGTDSAPHEPGRPPTTLAPFLRALRMMSVSSMSSWASSAGGE